MITREIKVLETDFKCWFHHLLSNFNKLHNLSRPVFSLGKKSFKISIMSATWRRQWHPTPVLLHGKNPMDGGAWWATVHGVAQSQTQLSALLSLFTFMHWRRQWQPTPVLLPGESHGRRSLVGCSPWGL